MAVFVHVENQAEVTAIRISATVIVIRGRSQVQFAPGDWLVVADQDKTRPTYGFLTDDQFREKFRPRDSAAERLWRITTVLPAEWDLVDEEGRTRRIEL